MVLCDHKFNDQLIKVYDFTIFVTQLHVLPVLH